MVKCCRTIFRTLSNIYGGALSENNQRLKPLIIYAKELDHRCFTGSLLCFFLLQLPIVKGILKKIANF